ncbi:MAG: folate-binding protein YgfZ [Gammaproteobacteria bacterium]|nr:folate-binding protein YgfZ [Gammaproteobacteria bacterium]
MNGMHLQTVELDDLGALRVTGADAARFLQGQLSNDLGRVSAERSALAGLHNPRGRTVALLRIVHLAPNDFLALLPRELAAPVAARLTKYVLRAKVTVGESQSWRVTGLIACGLGAAGELRSAQTASSPLAAYPCAAGEQRRVGDDVVICVDERPARWLLIAPREVGRLPHGEPARREIWRQLDIISGLPQVYGATSEVFVAQMLNLDVVGAIAFDKGCYTGQEVIARAHYRGRVKRRLQRFRSRGPLDLKPGDSGELPDGHAFTVVEAVRLEDGRCEFLAVAPLPTSEQDLSATTQPDAMLERVSAPLAVRPSQAGAAALTRTNVGAPSTGAALHAAVPAELSTTGAVWAPFASSPAAPRRAGTPVLPPGRVEELPHDLERLELPYALPD